LDELTTSPSAARKAGLAVNTDGRARSAFELLSYPGIEAADAAQLWPAIAGLAPAVLEQLAIDAKYAVYLERQRGDVEAVLRDEARAIPDWVKFDELPGLSMETRQKFMAQRPTTIAQAQSIDGITPAAITLLLSVIRRGHMRKAG
jgi:tRNA uridine 5-carboxymethylaminomethyl modification enzyme